MPTGIYNHKKGYTFSDEHRKNLSNSHKGHKPSPKTIKKIVDTRKCNGYTHSIETRKKIGDANRGKKRNPIPISVREKISNTMKNRELSNKHKERISKSRLGMKFSDEHRKNISIGSSGHRPQIQGEKSHCWRGGISSMVSRIKNLSEYNEWRQMIFERDNYQCQYCRQVGGYLNVHHIKAISEIIRDRGINTLDKAINCSKLWDMDNGTTLCVECHKSTDNFGFKLANKVIKK